jgi:hypothetical protein
MPGWTESLVINLHKSPSTNNSISQYGGVVKYLAPARAVRDSLFGNGEKEEFPSALGGESHATRISVARDFYFANLGHSKVDVFIRPLINRAVLVNDQMSVTVAICPETYLCMYDRESIFHSLLSLVLLLPCLIYTALKFFRVLFVKPALIFQLPQQALQIRVVAVCCACSDQVFPGLISGHGFIQADSRRGSKLPEQNLVRMLLQNSGP